MEELTVEEKLTKEFEDRFTKDVTELTNCPKKQLEEK